MMNKYEMYEAYYKEQYCNNVACIEAVYPELLQDEVIAHCITQIKLIASVIDQRMKAISELTQGESDSVRIPGKIHNVTIKGALQ